MPEVDGDRDSESEAGSAEDPLDQLLSNYNFVCNPEMRIKFKQQLPGCTAGLCVAKPWSQGARFRVTLKPIGNSDRISRSIQKLLVVPTHSQVALFSRKIQLGWFRLQGVAGYNWQKHKPTLDYRVTTKWGDGPRLRRKERLNLRDSMQLRCKWNLECHFPDLEGHIGMEGNGMEAVDVDWGRLEFEISQLDVVLQSPVKWGKQPIVKASSKDMGGQGGRTASGQGEQSNRIGEGSKSEALQEAGSDLSKAGPHGFMLVVKEKFSWLSEQVASRIRGDS